MSNKPPIEVPQGAIRLNTDSQKLEFFAQDRWYEFATDSPVLDGGARGLFGGGESPSIVDTIDFITISTAGNATDFGNLSQSRRNFGGGADRTRGLFMGGYTPSHVDTVDFVTIASTGNAADFGNLTQSRSRTAGFNNSTRGVRAGGNPYTDTIDFATIQSAGDFIDFGNLSYSPFGASAAASPTRGIVAGGQTPSSGVGGVNTIEYVTTSTTGNTRDFGDMTETRREGCGCSNSVRAVFGTGFTSPSSPYSASDNLDFITISTEGNAVTFGDLTYARVETYAAVTSPTRAVLGAGMTPSIVNTLDYIAIMTTGNGVDFGDLSQARATCGSFSNGNGGL